MWPCSDDILLEFTSFLATLHWTHGAADLGRYCLSCLELLVVFELSSGHMPTREK